MMRNCDENRYLSPDSQRKTVPALQVLLLIALLLASGGSTRGEVLGVSDLIWRDETTGYALSGLDPVSYFGPNGPVQGKGKFEFATKHGVWRFANEGNFSAFRHAPETYKPQFGGYGAYAMAIGKIVEPNPRIWHVSRSKIYLFHTQEAKASWIENEYSLSVLARENWAKIVTRAKPVKIQKN